MKLETFGLIEDSYQKFKQRKIEMIPFRPRDPKHREQENIPDWLLLFHKINTYDTETNEKR